MYVYLLVDAGKWQVGFFDPSGIWQPESYHITARVAANRVHYLNGGSGPDPGWHSLPTWAFQDGLTP